MSKVKKGWITVDYGGNGQMISNKCWDKDGNECECNNYAGCK